MRVRYFYAQQKKKKGKESIGLSNIAKSRRRRNSRGTRCSKINRTVVPAVKREIDRRKAAMIFRHVRETVAVYGRHGQMDLSKAKTFDARPVPCHQNISIRDGFSRRISLRAGVPSLNLEPIDARPNFYQPVSEFRRGVVIDFPNSRTPGSRIDYSLSLFSRKRERE